MINCRLLLLPIIFLTVVRFSSFGQQKIDLAGTWKFSIDPGDKGISEKWFDTSLPDFVSLPGSMSTNDKGDAITLQTKWTGQIVDSSYFKNAEYAKYREPGNLKIPFWLQSLKHYQGAAWYQRVVTIPANWKNKDIMLFLERCHWESRLWVDGVEAGMRNSLGTPHLYPLTNELSPGTHTLTLRVDNRIKDIDPGVNSHSISDHTQTNWNGIVGQLFLEAREAIHIGNLKVSPDIGNHKISAEIKVINPTGKPVAVNLALIISGLTPTVKTTIDLTLKSGENLFALDVSMGKEVKLWSEFHPDLYKITATLTEKITPRQDIRETTFGMREIKAVGRQLQINGKPLFLRGTLECAIFPKTGFPPTSTKEWLRIFRICRAHGLNHIRFHSWCPPEAAFAAADEAGFYLHVECSSWCNQSTKLGEGFPFDKYLYEESRRMVETYGNHPSFCMMAYGNEPGGPKHSNFLKEFVSYWKNNDNRRIYTSGAGWPNLEVNDYLSTPGPRIQGWGEGVKSIINAHAPSTDYDWSDKIASLKQPVVSHEIGQWCVYPNFKEITKYTGVVRAKNFEIFQETLKEHGMAQLADSFLLASGKLQALCYKAEIEAALRTPGFSGFQLLDLHDFPGQGSALVGVLDAFWEEKGYITPKEYSQFCNATVPLARLKKCIFTNEETLEASVEVAHYGDLPMTGCTPEWKILDQLGKTVQTGLLTKTDIPLGNCIRLGKISFPLSSIHQAVKLKLEVAVGSFTNSWDFWVYPAINTPPANLERIRISTRMDQRTRDYLDKGGSVLLTLPKGSLKPEYGGNVAIGFSSIFWNTAWTRGQAPHTLGILCNPNHPALADFPTEDHSNWQWWDAMSHAGAINLTAFPAGIRPIVRVIDDWFTNRPLALIFEAKTGKGKILVTGIDFSNGMDHRPEAKQLLYSLERYMTGKEFNPITEVSAEILQKLTE